MGSERPTVWTVSEPDFEWGDLPANEEAARMVAKVTNSFWANYHAPFPPMGLHLHHWRGGQYQALVREVEPQMVAGMPLPVERQYGVRDLATGTETWAPMGAEGPTRPDVTVGSVRNLCGIVELERKVAALEAQNRTLQARVDDLAAQRVQVRTV